MHNLKATWRQVELLKRFFDYAKPMDGQLCVPLYDRFSGKFLLYWEEGYAYQCTALQRINRFVETGIFEIKSLKIPETGETRIFLCLKIPLPKKGLSPS